MAADPHAPNAPRRIPAAERRRQAVEMRKAGASFRAIARALHVSLSVAHGYVETELAKLAEDTREDTTAVLQLELLRLDEVWRAGYELLTQRDYDERGRLLGYTYDTDTRLKAMDRLNRVAQRRSALLGLDAPIRTELTGANGGPVNIRGDLLRMTDEELREEARRHGIPMLEPEPMEAP